VDADCLRNAVNSFFYRQPESLPPMAPASALSSEPHSFSRVFTAAWLESLAAMAEVRGTSPDALASAAVDAGRLLAGAVSAARIASNYFAQVAAGLLTADERLTGGEFRAAIRRAFVGRGILAMSSAAALAGAGPSRDARARRARASTLPTIEVPVDGRAYGLRLRRLLVEAPLGATRWTAASAAPDLGPLAAAPPARASRAFVEDLLRRGRVDLGRPEGAGGDGPRAHHATHVLVRDGRRVRLVRRLFHAAAPAAERRCNAALDGCTTSGGAFRPGMSCRSRSSWDTRASARRCLGCCCSGVPSCWECRNNRGRMRPRCRR
jgi:hypothetical protein